MKYLGLVLDSRWNFREHFRHLAPRLTKAAAALGSLLPNLGGPSVACRRLYTAAVRSMALYGSPIWAEALKAENIRLLRRPQRLMAIRAARAYRTVSYEAACALAGSVPWDLDAEMLARIYRVIATAKLRGEYPLPVEVQRLRQQARDEAIVRWQQRLEEPTAGVRTVEAIRPVLVQWLGRRHGSLSFRVTQLLTGHGCFGRYLFRVAQKEETPACHHCGEPEDTAEHTLAECPAWNEQRARLVAAIDRRLSLPAVAEAMVESDLGWDAVRDFCEEVLALKEEAERARERLAEPNSLRRRRVGGRRLAHNRRIP